MTKLDTYTCYFINSDTSKQFASIDEAKKAAEDYCGNSSYVKPLPSENTFFYGPGDGTTSVMIRQDVKV